MRLGGPTRPTGTRSAGLSGIGDTGAARARRARSVHQVSPWTTVWCRA